MPFDFWAAKKFSSNRFQRILPPKKKHRRKRGDPPFVPYWFGWLVSGLLAGGIVRDFILKTLGQ